MSLRAVAGQVAIAQIVGQDEDDIRSHRRDLLAINNDCKTPNHEQSDGGYQAGAMSIARHQGTSSDRGESHQFCCTRRRVSKTSMPRVGPPQLFPSERRQVE